MRGYLATMEDKPSPIVHSKGADFHYQGIFEGWKVHVGFSYAA